MLCLTFVTVLPIDLEIEVCPISKTRYSDDFTFQVPDISVRAIDGYTLRLLLRFELEVHVRCHLAPYLELAGSGRCRRTGPGSVELSRSELPRTDWSGGKDCVSVEG